MRILVIAILFALVFNSVSRAQQVDTDGDGLLDLMDVPEFDPDAIGVGDYASLGIRDLDGADLLVNLQVLNLSGYRVSMVDNGDFDRLTNLEQLDLDRNPITRIRIGPPVTERRRLR